MLFRSGRCLTHRGPSRLAVLGTHRPPPQQPRGLGRVREACGDPRSQAGPRRGSSGHGHAPPLAFSSGHSPGRQRPHGGGMGAPPLSRRAVGLGRGAGTKTPGVSGEGRAGSQEAAAGPLRFREVGDSEGTLRQEGGWERGAGSPGRTRTGVDGWGGPLRGGAWGRPRGPRAGGGERATAGRLTARAVGGGARGQIGRAHV